MTIPFWCVLAAALLPLIFAGFAKIGARSYDNNNVRGWQAKLEGRRLRAHQAQLNSYEAFPPFAAAVIIAHLAGASASVSSGLAIAFVVLRMMYGYCYIADKATARSLVWSLAYLCMLGLFIISA